MQRMNVKEMLEKTAVYFGLAGQPIAEAATERVQVLEEKVAALEARVSQHAEDIDALRAEVIRLRAKL